MVVIKYEDGVLTTGDCFSSHLYSVDTERIKEEDVVLLVPVGVYKEIPLNVNLMGCFVDDKLNDLLLSVKRPVVLPHSLCVLMSYGLCSGLIIKGVRDCRRGGVESHRIEVILTVDGVIIEYHAFMQIELHKCINELKRILTKERTYSIIFYDIKYDDYKNIKEEILNPSIRNINKYKINNNIIIKEGEDIQTEDRIYIGGVIFEKACSHQFNELREEEKIRPYKYFYNPS